MKTLALTTLVLTTSLRMLAQPSAPPSPESTRTRWQMVQPDAKLLIGLDLKTLRESSAGSLVGSQLRGMLPKQAGPAAMFMPMILQALNDIDYVLISASGPLGQNASGQNTSGQNTSGQNQKDPDFVLVMEGRFAQSPLTFLMTGKPQEYHGAKIYDAPTNTAMQKTGFALLNENLLVVGDAKSLRGAIDRHAAPGLSNGLSTNGLETLRARAGQLGQLHDFWIVAPDLASLQAGTPGTPQPMAGIDGVEMGLGLHDGLLFDINILTKSEDMAQMMSQMVTSQLQSAVSSSQIDNAQALELASQVKVSSDGKRVRLSLQLSADELEHQLRALQTNRALAELMERNRPQPELRAEAKPEPAKPVSRKIRIVGLDEGVREIEMK